MKKPLTFGLVAFTAASFVSAAPATAATAQTAGCHAAYVDCVPADHDVDCIADKLPPIRLKQIGVDPYRLDRNKNGIGCETDESTPAPTTPAPAPTTKAPTATTKRTVTPPTTKAPTGAVRVSPKYTG